MKRIIVLFFISSLVLPLQKSIAQSQKSMGKKHIKEMCGCFTVSFEYAETFSPKSNYKFHDRYKTGGLEYIFVDEEGDDKLVLQHLLIVNDTMIIKHWRQDWLYENKNLLKYEKNLEWSKVVLSDDESRETWTQKVYQVDDSPRYQGYAKWIENDGKFYWESEVYAPLPRREYTKRNDYNVMLRNNKHELTEYGHIHELDNAKIIRTEAGDDVLVYEKGLNSYEKVEDSKCELAKTWWNRNNKYWVNVRLVWDELINEHQYVNIDWKVDDKKLWEQLFALGKKYPNSELNKDKLIQSEIRKAILPYLSESPSAWSVSDIKEVEKY